MTRQSANAASLLDVIVHLTIREHGQFANAVRTLPGTDLLRASLLESTERAQAGSYMLILSWPGVTATDLGPIMSSLIELQVSAQSSALISSFECRETADPSHLHSITT